MDIVIVAATFVGLVLLAVALYKATPPINFGTREEYAEIREGRRLMPVAIAALLVPTIILAVKGNWVGAVLVVLPAVICGTLVAAEPRALYGALAYLVLAPIALGAVIAFAAARGS